MILMQSKEGAKDHAYTDSDVAYLRGLGWVPVDELPLVAAPAVETQPEVFKRKPGRPKGN